MASAVPGPLLKPPSGRRQGRRPAPGLRARLRERRSRRARPTRAGLCQGQGVMPRLGDGYRVNERTCPRRPASSSLPGARSPEPAPRCHRCHTPAHTSTRWLSPRMRTVWPGAQPRACAGPAPAAAPTQASLTRAGAVAPRGLRPRAALSSARAAPAPPRRVVAESQLQTLRLGLCALVIWCAQPAQHPVCTQ